MSYSRQSTLATMRRVENEKREQRGGLDIGDIERAKIAYTVATTTVAELRRKVADGDASTNDLYAASCLAEETFFRLADQVGRRKAEQIADTLRSHHAKAARKK